MNKTLYNEALALVLETEPGRIVFSNLLAQSSFACPITKSDEGAIALHNQALRLACDLAEANPEKAMPIIAQFFTGEIYGR